MFSITATVAPAPGPPPPPNNQMYPPVPQDDTASTGQVPLGFEMHSKYKLLLHLALLVQLSLVLLGFTTCVHPSAITHGFCYVFVDYFSQRVLFESQDDGSA